MRRRASRRAVVGLVSGVLASTVGCARPEPEPVPVAVPARTEWQDVLEIVERYALEGRYTLADSLLLDFTQRHAGSAEAAEARYWRAVLTLDPSNENGSSRQAISAIDDYLTGGPGLPRYGEALVLRRLAGQLEALRNVRPPAPVVFIDTTQLRQRGEEITKLRDSLTQTTAELERIRQRLRATRPETPPPAARPPRGS